jgi:uncharacterized protein YecE (DUF72 family)
MMAKKETADDEHSNRVLVGTASWSDPGFVEHWYPKKMPAGERLAWYAQHFEMVEVNSSFYSVPESRLVDRWCRCTPTGFTFDLKLHQLLSRHSTNLKLLPPALQTVARTDAKGKVMLTPEIEQLMIEQFHQPIEILHEAGKLGVLLLQLSPAFSPKMHKLRELDELLRAFGNYRVAVEFRNRNWVGPEHLHDTLAFLRTHSAAFVHVDAPKGEHFTVMPSDLNEITTPSVAYLRLHGRDLRAYTTGKTVASRFNYDYNDAEITEVAERSRTLAGKAKEVHVVFNNNALDYAPHAALRLRRALGQVLAVPPRQSELF